MPRGEAKSQEALTLVSGTSIRKSFNQYASDSSF